MASVQKVVFSFLMWTMTSFLCHKLAKEFIMAFVTSSSPLDTSSEYMTSSTRCISAVILTVAQCLLCHMTVSPAADLPRYGLTVTRVTHALATLATNLSMAFIHAASTFAIKLTEPVTMVIAHRLAFKTSITMETWVSLPLMIAGAFIFTDAALDKSTILGVSLAMGSNIILAMRNVSMKIIQEKSTPNHREADAASEKGVITLRHKSHLCTVYTTLAMCGVVYWYLHSRGIITVSTLTPFTIMLLLGSAVFHVGYSYISTNIVLAMMTVVSHSIANIFKRLLVVLLLYAGGQRSAALGSWAGLGLSALGLVIYITPRLRQADISGVVGSGSLRKLKKVAGLVIGVIICTVSVVMALELKYNYISNKLSPKYDSRAQLLNVIDFPNLKENNHHSSIFDSEQNKEFLSKRLLVHPLETDFLSKQLNENEAIVAEAQRIHINVLRDLIGRARHVMLFDVTISENKGDPAIAVGEILLFRRMNLTLVYYCTTFKCHDDQVKRAKVISQKYAKSDLVIFMHGGGNVVGYPYHDLLRRRVLNAFPDTLKVLFSQSIWLHSGIHDLRQAEDIYTNRTNFVMYLRDRQSLGIAQKHFKGIKHILMPDLAFNIGMVPRQLPPAFDVLWLKRGDEESPKYSLGEVLKNVTFTYHVSDYYHKYPSNKGDTELEASFLIASTGFQFLQRGRILITDRLHGHILSTLLNIPHILFDNPPFYKLSSFHKTWTANQSSVVIVDNKEQAISEAQKMLARYDAVLPKVGPYMNV